MYVPKGYRAREAAAKLRNNRKLVSDEVRAARAAALPGYNAGEEVKAEAVVAEVAVAVKADEAPAVETEATVAAEAVDEAEAPAKKPARK